MCNHLRMLGATIAGLCFRFSNTVCKGGDRVITPVQMLVGGFVAVGLIGLLYLLWRGR
jgi:hypothetical protein